jgi:Flp pilus assembly pilin Flp
MEVPVERLKSIVADESGQTTAEYSLVLLVAGLVVGVLATLVKSGALANMFKEILSGLVARAGG